MTAFLLHKIGAASLLLAGLLLSGGEVGAQTQPRPGTFPFAKATPAPTSRSTVAPIKFAANARTRRDFLKAQRLWTGRVLEAPFRERSKGQPWAAAASAFVQRTLDVWPGESLVAHSAELTEQGAGVLAQGCHDPLVRYLAAWVRWEDSREWHAARTTFRKLLPDAESLPGSRALARFVAADYLRASAAGYRDPEDVPDKHARLTAESLADGSYSMPEEPLFVRHLLGETWEAVFDAHHAKLLAALRGAKLSEWASEAISGAAAVEVAWEKRGSGFGDTVSPRAQADFERVLAEARKRLTRAWELRRDDPIAPAGMISVAMGGATSPREVRTWFDRVIAAECDYTPAYERFAMSLLPRWRGTHEQLLDFGRACLATQRFDTEAPTGVFIALSTLNRDLADFRALCRRPDVAPDLLRASQGFLDEPSRAGEKRLRLSFLAVNAWLAGDLARAAQALAAAGPARLHPSPLGKLQAARTDESGFRGMLAASTGPSAVAFARAEAELEAGKASAAAASYRAALAQAGGGATAHIRGRLGVAETEEKLAGGDWVALPADPALAGWTARIGEWAASKDGLPEVRVTQGPARIIYGARVGPEFELRGEVAITGEPVAEHVVGLLFGHQFERGNWERWHGCQALLNTDPGVGRQQAIYQHRDGQSTLPAVDCELRAVNEFTLRVERGLLTWQFNGKTIHEQAGIARAILPEGRIGVGSFSHESGVTMTLRKLEVRRLQP